MMRLFTPTPPLSSFVSVYAGAALCGFVLMGCADDPTTTTVAPFQDRESACTAMCSSVGQVCTFPTGRLADQAECEATCATQLAGRDVATPAGDAPSCIENASFGETDPQHGACITAEDLDIVTMVGCALPADPDCATICAEADRCAMEAQGFVTRTYEACRSTCQEAESPQTATVAACVRDAAGSCDAVGACL